MRLLQGEFCRRPAGRCVRMGRAHGREQHDGKLAGLGDLTDDELFASHYTEHLGRLDPTEVRAANAEEAPNERWTRWAGARLRRERAALAEITRHYGAVLDPDYVEVLEAIVDDPFIEAVVELADGTADARSWRVQINMNRGLREAHFRTLVSAITVHNRVAEEAAAYRTRSLLPRAAAIDVEIGAHEDLVLDTKLGPGFWAAKPTPGALRAS